MIIDKEIEIKKCSNVPKFDLKLTKSGLGMTSLK